MDDLDANEARVLDRFRRAAEAGRAPTLRELGLALALSHSTVQGVVGRLLAKGHLVQRPGHRGLSLPGARGPLAVPVVGWVAAGPPIPPEAPEGETLDLERIFAADDVQILKVRGTSMVEAAILDGDYVAVRPCCGDDVGRVVVAELDGCHTLKVYRLLRGAPYLYPRNREMQPIRLDPRDDPRLLGVLVGVVRIPARK